jgi:hypothetical protein
MVPHLAARKTHQRLWRAGNPENVDAFTIIAAIAKRDQDIAREAFVKNRTRNSW